MKFSAFVLCLILPVLANGQQDEETSSLKVRINQRGINFLKDVAFNAVETKALPLQLPPLSASKVLANSQIGDSVLTLDASYALNGLVLESLSFVEAELFPSPPRTLFLNASMVDGMVSGEYNLNFTFLGVVTQQNVGHFEANFRSGIFVSISLGQSENRFLSKVISDRCLTQIHSISIDVTAAELGNEDVAFQQVIEEEFTSLLRQQLCSTFVTSSLSVFNTFIGGVRVDFPVLAGIGLDLSLVRPPIAASNYVDLDFNGKCYSQAQPDLILPYRRNALPEPTVTTAMGQIVIGNYVIQTCLHSLFASGVFSITVDLDQLPVSLPIKLDSTFLGRFIPGILTLAGPGRPIRIRTEATRPPSIAIEMSTINLSGSFDVAVAVVNNSEESRPSLDAFVLSANLSATGRIFVESSTVSGAIDNLNLDLAVKSSMIGVVNINLIRLFIGGSLPQTILPALNQLLGNGISIPSAFGFDLTNVGFTFFNEALELRGDFTPTPTSAASP